METWTKLTFILRNLLDGRGRKKGKAMRVRLVEKRRGEKEREGRR